MPPMDDTQITRLLEELADADPAEAPDIAERLTGLLAERLEMTKERPV
jgi:hypothetical protein